VVVAERRFFQPSSVGGLLIGTLLALGLTACTVDPEPAPSTGGGYVEPPPPAFPTTGSPSTSATIARGETLTSEPGQGAGLFVLYLGEGTYRIVTICDTNVSGLSCPYAYTLRAPTGSLAVPVPDANDGSVQIVRYQEGFDVGLTSTTDADGVTVRVDPPGAPLEVGAWLDNLPDERLFYWVGPDGIHEGADSNPVLFVPDAP
jgi:hypothetical protein